MAIYFKDVELGRINSLGGGNWKLTNLTDITVLFGKNGSGKSLILRAWNSRYHKDSHYIAPERGGEIQFDSSLLVNQVDALSRSQRNQSNFFPNYRQNIITRIQAYYSKRGAVRGEVMPCSPIELEKLVNGFLPHFLLELTNTNPFFKLTRVSNSEKVDNITLMSSGETQMFTLMIDIVTVLAIWEIDDCPNRVLLIDEPDVHIHPDLQSQFADFLCQVAETYKIQMVVATHSTTLLAALGSFGNNKTSVVYLNPEKTEFKATKINAMQKEIAACLGGNILMGYLFGSPLLLVEGDDDFRIWSQVSRHGEISLAVLPCNGQELKKYQKTFETIFLAITSPKEKPLGYALLDGDTSLPDRNNPNNPQQFIRFVRLNCRESENLYLTNEVLLDLKYRSWEEASEMIVSKADKYKNKVEILKSAKAWDRRTQDLKSVISEIVLILDPMNISWSYRVGRCIGHSKPKPTGELADFLGSELVQSLWEIDLDIESFNS